MKQMNTDHTKDGQAEAPYHLLLAWTRRVPFDLQRFCHHSSTEAPVGAREELPFSPRLRRSTSSHVLHGVGLGHWLLHLRDHQVCGGEELVCGDHQPGRAAAHHHVFCRVNDLFPSLWRCINQKVVKLLKQMFHITRMQKKVQTVQVKWFNVTVNSTCCTLCPAAGSSFMRKLTR